MEDYKSKLREIYIGAFFEENQSPQVELLDFSTKVTAAISRKFTDSVSTENLERYYARLQSVVNQAPKVVIKELPLQADVNVFKRLFDRRAFGWPPSLPKPVLHLITR